MPAVLLRFLPHAMVIAAVLGALAWIDHKGYQRAQKDARYERAVTAAMLTRAVREIEGNSAQHMADEGQRTRDDIAALSLRHTTVIQPIIEKEIARDPHLSDPTYALSPGLLDAINIARASLTCSAAAGQRIVCAVPRSGDTEEWATGNAGAGGRGPGSPVR